MKHTAYSGICLGLEGNGFQNPDHPANLWSAGLQKNFKNDS